MKPLLTKSINPETFRDYYWLKEDLQSFCRENGMSASGSKADLTDRVEVFLRTGEIKKPVRVTRKKVDDSNLSLDTIITEGHRCSQNVRYFFMSVIPNFHFSTYIQNFFKNNVGKTYQDVVDAWYEEEERKKDPSYKREIGSQFEYNRFTRDFFADPSNEGKTRQDAIDAWNIIKRQPGSNEYKSSQGGNWDG